MPTNGSLNRKLRMALVGGGQGSLSVASMRQQLFSIIVPR